MHPNLVWVLVRLNGYDINGARFFICTERDIQHRVVERYLAFMKRHNFRRPGGGSSVQAILNIKDVAEFENNWNVFTDMQDRNSLDS